MAVVQRLIETVSLFVLIGVAILRPLVAESYDPAGSPLTEALDAVSDPSPLRTLVFDLLILSAACGWLLARMVGSPRRYRWTGLEWGAALVAIAVVISCCVAGNKRLAINASVDWLCYPILTIALVQLAHRPWHRRLLLAALLATACTQAIHCFEQYSVGFEETWEHYQSIKQEFWARQGIDLDSGRVAVFERRMLAREATGFMPHSNVTGSYLVLCAMAAGALAVAMWKRARNSVERLLAVGATIGATLIIGAVPLTKSVGAMTAGVAGLAVWAAARLLRPWINAHRTRAFVIGWACAAAGLTTVVGYGLYHNKLPGVSLTFRWQYWRASSELIADHALTGVGRENFGRHYLRYKPIESPEEVANPHNLFVQAAADWGLLGLVGMAAMMVGASRAAGFSPRELPGIGDTAPTEAGGSPGAGAMTAWMAALGFVVILGRLPLLGTDDPNFLYYVTVTTGLSWVVGFVCFAFGVMRGKSPGDPWGRLVPAGAAIGMLTFVLHDMINFATFVPGAATTLFALLAFCIAERSARPELRAVASAPCGGRRALNVHHGGWTLRPRANVRALLTPRRLKPAAGLKGVARLFPLAALITGTVVVVCVALIPVARAADYLRLARAAARQLVPAPGVAHGFSRGGHEMPRNSRTPPLKRWATRSAPITAQLAYHHFQSAAEADPRDPTPHVERAKWLMRASSAPELRDDAFRFAAESLTEAIQRDPFSAHLRRMQMRLYQMKAAGTQSTDDRLAAIEAAKAALELYPLDPNGIVALADRRFEAGEASHSDDLLRDAIKSYERALALDDSRLAWETLRRFQAKERQAIQAKIRRARLLLHEQP